MGKFDWVPFASNENMFIVFMDGWVERGRVFVLSTFTKDAAGVEKRRFATEYVLQANATAKDFTIRDLDQKAFYWFNCTRNDENNITLNLKNPVAADTCTIQLTKLK